MEQKITNRRRNAAKNYKLSSKCSQNLQIVVEILRKFTNRRRNVAKITNRRRNVTKNYKSSSKCSEKFKSALKFCEKFISVSKFCEKLQIIVEMRRNIKIPRRNVGKNYKSSSKCDKKFKSAL